MTRAEHQAQKQLASNKEVIIKQAKKWGSLVVQNGTEYVREAHRLLADTSTYTKLLSDEIHLDLKAIVDAAWRYRVLSQKARRFLLQPVCSTPYFYHLPKVHKALVNPPGRPIIASTNSFTNRLSVYIDSFLQSKVCQLPLYIRDSSHIIDSLKHYTWEEGYMWASLDIASLCTSIPREVGLTSVQYLLTKNGDMNSRQSEVLFDSIEFCLTHNYFNFLD